MLEGNWVDSVDVPVPLDREEFAELLFTSRGFLRLHAESKFGRESRVRAVMDEVIELGDRGVPDYPVVLAHPYRAWVDLKKVLKRGLGDPGLLDHEHREPRLRIAKKIDFAATQVGSRLAALEKEAKRERSAELVASFDGKEFYNYGTLLSLAEEQNDALEQFTAGRLDLWGKSLINSRSDAILRQLLAIGRIKARQGSGIGWLRAIRSDLDCISDVGLVGRPYSEGAFRVLESSLKALESDSSWAPATTDQPRLP